MHKQHLIGRILEEISYQFTIEMLLCEKKIIK